jgi:hypothetical protein
MGKPRTKTFSKSEGVQIYTETSNRKSPLSHITDTRKRHTAKMKLLNLAFLTVFHLTNRKEAQHLNQRRELKNLNEKNLIVGMNRFELQKSQPAATELTLEDQNAFSRLPEFSIFETADDVADDDDSLVDRSRRSLRSERKHRRRKNDRRRKEKDRRNRRRKRNKEKVKSLKKIRKCYF